MRHSDPSESRGKNLRISFTTFSMTGTHVSLSAIICSMSKTSITATHTFAMPYIHKDGQRYDFLIQYSYHPRFTLSTDDKTIDPNMVNLVNAHRPAVLQLTITPNDERLLGHLHIEKASVIVAAENALINKIKTQLSNDVEFNRAFYLNTEHPQTYNYPVRAKQGDLIQPVIMDKYIQSAINALGGTLHINGHSTYLMLKERDKISRLIDILLPGHNGFLRERMAEKLLAEHLKLSNSTSPQEIQEHISEQLMDAFPGHHKDQYPSLAASIVGHLAVLNRQAESAILPRTL